MTHRHFTTSPHRSLRSLHHIAPFATSLPSPLHHIATSLPSPHRSLHHIAPLLQCYKLLLGLSKSNSFSMVAIFIAIRSMWVMRFRLRFW
ncbi:MAG: hypothetical protein IPN94_23390 [Sphingobacteriales bacterium]|nr:hypothetical protein [Sphingobacteriales bacterium]